MRKRDDNKIEAIIQASVRLINEHGFASTSISRIAREAGVSPATIYIYFESKEDLLNKLYLTVKGRLADELSQLNNRDGTWKERFYSLFDRSTKLLAEHLDKFVFLNQCSANPSLSDTTREEGMRVFSKAYGFFEDGVSQGILKQIPPEVLLMVAFSPLMQIISEASSKELNPDLELLGKLKECAWDAIRG